MNTYITLAARIRQNLMDLERVVVRAESLATKYKQSGDDGYLDGAALNLHSFYAGAERIFEDIAIELGEGVPSGSSWHHDLLVQMAAPIDGLRPAVVSRETRDCLDEYRGFRHVVRNVYTFNLRPSRIMDLVGDLPDCYQAVLRDVGEFAQFLEKVEDDPAV